MFCEFFKGFFVGLWFYAVSSRYQIYEVEVIVRYRARNKVVKSFFYERLVLASE